MKKQKKLPETYLKIEQKANLLKVGLYDNEPEAEYYKQFDSDEILEMLYEIRNQYSTIIQQAIINCNAGIMRFEVDFLPF